MPAIYLLLTIMIIVPHNRGTSFAALEESMLLWWDYRATNMDRNCPTKTATWSHMMIFRCH